MGIDINSKAHQTPLPLGRGWGWVNDNLSDFDLAAALPLLSDQRREQVLRFRHEQGRRECAAAYLLLCEGLRREYGITEPPVFEYGEHGKPVLVGRPDIHFNLSHCRVAVLCVLSDRPVGCDVETIRPYKDSLARYTMNDAELTAITQHPSPAVEFTRLWTMKEAKLKLTGHGLCNDMKSVLDGTEHFETVVNEEKGYVYSLIQ